MKNDFPPEICNIERVGRPSREEFLHNYVGRGRPVILDARRENEAVRELTKRSRLLADHAEDIVWLYDPFTLGPGGDLNRKMKDYLYKFEWLEANALDANFTMLYCFDNAHDEDDYWWSHIRVRILF
ncbi:hypothetical protein CYMTET_50713 [Cymbomonas tetramitiformis]|uniref:Uncharacterized protein n=1 Tax=Cymbomonas tetramitiformis TaxID=36881 RepID=A0AAE0BPI3_9CHLO|nr:hypothetical protein CYMTET_50713 [Cymbomonas tetramitiformis]